MMNRLNRDRTLHLCDNFIAIKILQYTGLQENLKEIKKVADLARSTVDKSEEQQTEETNNGLIIKLNNLVQESNNSLLELKKKFCLNFKIIKKEDLEIMPTKRNDEICSNLKIVSINKRICPKCKTKKKCNKSKLCEKCYQLKRRKVVRPPKEQLLKEKNPNKLIKLEKRLALLSAKVAIVKVGANSEIELKEKTDRVEDAICATKAAIKEGIVPGGGIALLNASANIKAKSEGEQVLLQAIKAPYETILTNAGLEVVYPKVKNKGLNVVTGKEVNMVRAGIIDPLLVTKSALKNAASVATTILSTDCVINNLRIDESNR